MPDRRPLIAGNWKMNGLNAEARNLAAELAARMTGLADPAFDMLVCPPFTAIGTVAEALRDSVVELGGQDCHPDAKGAHTGDVSAPMLADLGCGWVIVGHSERRQDHGEDDALVAAKAKAARAAGLNAIVCVGETEAERDAGATLDVVSRQLDGSVPDGADAGSMVIAYEPVWAIGTGRTPTPDDVQAVHAFIRERVGGRAGMDAQAVRILYGGSMKPANAAELLALADVDGGLVGGASLIADDFWAIAEAAG